MENPVLSLNSSDTLPSPSSLYDLMFAYYFSLVMGRVWKRENSMSEQEESK